LQFFAASPFPTRRFFFKEEEEEEGNRWDLVSESLLSLQLMTGLFCKVIFKVRNILHHLLVGIKTPYGLGSYFIGIPSKQVSKKNQAKQLLKKSNLGPSINISN
jgi:hypothetical protein